MKRLFLTLLGAAVLAVPAVQAQKVNREALNAAIEKSDAEIQDPKKAAKAATWIKRAQAYYAALEAPTKGVFTTMPSALLKSTCGNPKSQETVKLASGPAEAFDYNYITVYLQGDKVVAWTQKKQMVGITCRFPAPALPVFHSPAHSYPSLSGQSYPHHSLPMS